MKYKVFILCIVLLGVFSCKKKCQDKGNPDCENFEPCYGKQKTSAEFIIEEKVGGRWFLGDTVDGWNPVRFTALQDADSFIWSIGAEKLYTKSITRYDFPSDEWIDVTLIVVNKYPHKNCFPDDDGRDTFRKQFYSWQTVYWHKGDPQAPASAKFFPVFGGYWGYNESNPKDTYLFRLIDTMMWVPACKGTNSSPRYYSNEVIDGIPFKGISNLSPCLTTVSFIQQMSPKAVYFKENSNVTGSNSFQDIRTFPGIKAYAYLSRDLKTITVDYQWLDTINNKVWYSDKFIGKKMW
jgi:hypothetical protein